MNYAKRAEELKETIQEHRRYLHRHAELPYQEHKTTAYLVSKLTDLGTVVDKDKEFFAAPSACAVFGPYL